MKAVLRLTGLSADTLRGWERRYQAVEPSRSKSGRRVYSTQEANRLKILAELVRRGHAIGGIAQRPDRTLVSMLARSKGEAAPLGMHSGERTAKDTLKLLNALEEFDIHELRLLLVKARYNMSPRDFSLYLVPQLMVQVGIKIEQGEFSIAQEHALSVLIRQNLWKIYDDLADVDGSIPSCGNLAFATPEGHYHDFGILLAAITCRYHGFKTTYLGPNLPTQSLCHAVESLNPYAVVLGISSLPPEEERVDAQKFIADLNSQMKGPTAIWIGGNGVSKIKRSRLKRDLWIFESIDAFEAKIQNLTRSAR